MRTLIFEGFGFLQQYKIDFCFLTKKVFPYGEDPYKYTYLRDFSHIEISLIRVNHKAQDISIWGFLKTTQATWMPSSFATRFPCVCLIGIHPLWRVCPSSFLSIRDMIYYVCCLSVHLDRSFPQYRRLWMALSNGSVYLKFYPFQLPLHSMGPSPTFTNVPVE